MKPDTVLRIQFCVFKNKYKNKKNKKDKNKTKEMQNNYLCALQCKRAIVEPVLKFAAFVVDTVVPDNRSDEAEAVL